MDILQSKAKQTLVSPPEEEAPNLTWIGEVDLECQGQFVRSFFSVASVMDETAAIVRNIHGNLVLLHSKCADLFDCWQIQSHC